MRFEYSPRPHTTAQEMSGAIPEKEKRRRLAALNEHQQKIQIARNNQLLGQTFEVLVDGASRRPASAARSADGQNRPGQWSGRSSSNRILNFTSPHSGLLGQYVHVRVTGAAPNSLVGEQVPWLGGLQV